MVAVSNLDTDRERRLDEVLALYLEAGPEIRAELLAGHPDLAIDLNRFFEDEDRFDQITAPLRDALEPNGPLPGGMIGPYEVLSEIGRGGMGVVYRARHCKLQRIVALKMLRAGRFASPADLQRFRREAEAAASLDHPNIVPIYEVGEAEGLPFLSMKLIEGGSLAEFISGAGPAAERKRQDWAARLMATVARAVHHAHQHGILHRDLKPGNILLAKDPEGLESGPPSGVPFLTDLGLAKRMTADSLVTQPGAILGTPSYMAPEQASGRNGAVTTAADVYGLGAILYELLTARPPFRGETPLETLQLIQEREPISPRALCPEVAPDLETVCLRCLEKDPARRYAGAQDLADDLDRYLNGEPIQARRVGTVARLSRWCRRQPILAGLAGCLVLSWLVAFALVTWQWRQAVANADEAVENFQEADRQRKLAFNNQKLAEENHARAEENFRLAHQAVNDFVKQVSEKDLLGIPGMQPARKKLLEQALVYLQKFADQNANEPRFRADLADAYFRIGKVTAAIGSKQKALVAHGKALELYDDLVRSHPGQAAFLEQRARLYIDLGMLQDFLGKQLDALASMEKSRSDWEALLRIHPEERGWRNQLAHTLNNLGSLYYHFNKPAQSLKSLERACAIEDALVKECPDKLEFQVMQANCLEYLGLLLEMQGKLAEAEKLLQRSWQIRGQLVKQYPGKHALQSQWAHACMLKGERQADKGQYDDALKTLKEGTGVLERLARNNPQVRPHQAQLAALCLATARVQIDCHQPGRALKSLNQAAALLTVLAKLFPNVPGYQSQLGETFFNQARAHFLLGQFHQELQAYQEAMQVQDKLVRRYPKRMDYQGELAITMNNLAVVLEDQGQTASAGKIRPGAQSHHRLALELLPESLQVRQYLDRYFGFLGEINRTRGRLAEAVAAARERLKSGEDQPHLLYRATRDLALTAALVGKGKAILSPEEAVQKETYLNLTLEALAKTLASGFMDRQRLQTDPALELLRQRDEFHQLIKNLR